MRDFPTAIVGTTLRIDIGVEFDVAAQMSAEIKSLTLWAFLALIIIVIKV